MDVPAILIEKLVKCYGDFKALEGIDLSVRRGDFVAFLGPNGAGKTTTINAITGLSNFQSGRVRVFGHDIVADYRAARKLIGLCAQEINFDPFLSIEQLLVYQAGYFGIPRKQGRQKARWLLEHFQLWGKRDQNFRRLSGGMKRRLLLCRALIHDPAILILDEPTAGADLELRHHTWNYLAELNREGKTIFLTTHYMEEAEKLAKTIVVIHQGRILHHGDKASLVGNASLENKYLELIRERADV
jgi:ABC-2 type transport system ATP-binding protein